MCPTWGCADFNIWPLPLGQWGVKHKNVIGCCIALYHIFKIMGHACVYVLFDLWPLFLGHREVKYKNALCSCVALIHTFKMMCHTWGVAHQIIVTCDLGPLDDLQGPPTNLVSAKRSNYISRNSKILIRSNVNARTDRQTNGTQKYSHKVSPILNN